MKFKSAIQNADGARVCDPQQRDSLVGVKKEGKSAFIWTSLRLTEPRSGHRREQGLALIITLIMLSVTLVMAIAFLAVANRERSSVNITADQANARAAAASALAAAQAQLIANVVSTPGGNYNYGLLVSTNYINAYGFDKSASALNPTNVNYDYYDNAAGPVNGADFESVVANLQYLPRAPVMVSATAPVGVYYLDLNRNGVFDSTGTNSYVDTVTGITNGVINEIGDPQWIGGLERPDSLHSADNHFIYRYAFIAVPVGNGLDLNYMHNQAFSRTVNSFASEEGLKDGYVRNQNVGSWEINLAAFLADLNTNEWDSPTAENSVNDPYNYQRWDTTFGNTGAAFEDSLSLLSWRYGFNYNSLATADQMMPNAAITYPYDNIDEYDDGLNLQTTTTNISEPGPDQNNPALSWAGANNTNRFYNLPVDLFDVTKSSTNFVSRLTQAGTNVMANGAHPTYDRYTFYRLLSELGSDSSADDIGKIDLNYSNAVVQFAGTSGLNQYIMTGSSIIPGAQTNLVPWTMTNFFDIAADRLLRTYTTNWFQSNPTNYLATYYGLTGYQFNIDPATGYGFTNNNPLIGCPLGTNFIPAFSLTNIPVLVNNGNTFVYSPAVNRLLQLTANIYDASTTNLYPSVFKPVFTTDGNRNIYISGYEPVPKAGLSSLAPPVTLTSLFTASSVPTDANVFGVPWIIGAKKNLPNFNQLYTLNTVQMTRILQVSRTLIQPYSVNPSNYQTNQLFVMSVTNQVGFSLWNSYSTNYPGPGPLTIKVNESMVMALSNGTSIATGFAPSFQTNISFWPGSGWITGTPPASRMVENPGSFISGSWQCVDLTPSALQYSPASFVPLNSSSGFVPGFNNMNQNELGLLPVLPQCDLMTTNWLQAYILDSNNRVIDYVQYSGPNSQRSINNELYDVSYTNRSQMWVTNVSGTVKAPGPNQGVADQMYVSMTGPSAAPAGGKWSPPSGNAPSGLSGTLLDQYEAYYFDAFFTTPTKINGQMFNNQDLTNEAPYTPTRVMYDLTLWQANDPLVHYLASDMTETNPFTGTRKTDDAADNPLPGVVQNAIGQSTSSQVVDDRYQPWGTIYQLSKMNGVDQNPYNLAYRDPLMYGSDNWDFPTNKYPTVGWLGRVHRGTPWQTVYLKATNIMALVNPAAPAYGTNTWMAWSGNGNLFDAYNSAPNQDTVLFDIFTTAPDDNASRGTLSVNQQHLAAWSGILSGVTVISNTTPVPNWASSPIQTNLVIQPGGLDTNSPLWRLVEGANGINATRANLFGSGGFAHAGDIVHVQALTEASPYLNNSDSTHQQYDVSDEMYEQIPQNILGLLRVSQAPRYVIYCYGQALRPAQDGIALDLAHNGLVTNYQVVAESDARAVVSVHPQVTLTIQPVTGNIIPVTNYTSTVENYSVLPPY